MVAVTLKGGRRRMATRGRLVRRSLLALGVTFLLTAAAGAAAAPAQAFPGSCILPWNTAGCAAKAAGNAVLNTILKWFSEAVTWVMKNLLTAWLFASPTPSLQGKDSLVPWIQSMLAPLVIVVAIASVFVAAIRLALSGDFKHLSDLGHSFSRGLLAAGLTAPATAMAITAGDLFSKWILDQVGLSAQSAVEVAFFYMAAIQTQPLLVIIMGTIIVLAEIIQFFMMVARNAMIVVLVGQMPLAASGSNTDMGQQWTQKSVSWLIAYVLYKPVAALLYAIALTMVGKTNVSTQMCGVALMILSILALPALMRLMVPATAALGGANAGAMSMAMVGGAIATGASLATMGAGGGAGGGGGLLGSFGGGFSKSDSSPMGGVGPTGVSQQLTDSPSPSPGPGTSSDSSPSPQGSPGTDAQRPPAPSAGRDGADGAGTTGAGGQDGADGSSGPGSTGGSGSSGADAGQAAQSAMSTVQNTLAQGAEVADSDSSASGTSQDLMGGDQ